RDVGVGQRLPRKYMMPVLAVSARAISLNGDLVEALIQEVYGAATQEHVVDRTCDRSSRGILRLPDIDHLHLRIIPESSCRTPCQSLKKLQVGRYASAEIAPRISAARARRPEPFADFFGLLGARPAPVVEEEKGQHAEHIV